jgi:outer membrane protein assembly factor BamD (BamD/ComL family)
VKGFLLFVFLVIFTMISVSRFVGGGGLLEYADEHPSRKGTATALYAVGRYYEFFGKDELCLKYFERIADRYPKSRYGMESQYAVALAYEHLKNYPRALEEFQEFLEKYPKSKYATSVRNNIDILQSR